MLHTIDLLFATIGIQSPSGLRISRPDSSAPTNKVIRLISPCALALKLLEEFKTGG